VGVYVDDLTIAAAKLETLARFKNEMSKRYDMKDLGELHYILGLQVKRDREARSLHLSQKQYINTVLERFGMLHCKPIKSPFRSKAIMSLRKEGEEKTDRTRYLAAVGSLMYAMLGTRPDLAYPVGLLGRFASDPSETHWEGVLSVFKYLKHTSDLGIIYSGGNEQLDGYSDADFATSDVDRRRVTSGYVFRLWGGAISWQSKKQPSVSLATGDAEYVALAQASRELMWLRSIMSELGFAPDKPITLYGDNQASISIAKNPVGHTRAKQIDIRFHYLRELVERDIISIEYIATNSMLADGLTKPLAPVLFARFLTMLGLVPITHRSIGRSAYLAMRSSDIIAESGITPHDLLACSAMTSPMTSFCSRSKDTSSDSDTSVWNGIPSEAPSIENAPSIINPSAALAALDKAILSLEVALDGKSTRLAMIAAAITLEDGSDRGGSNASSESDDSDDSDDSMATDLA